MDTVKAQTPTRIQFHFQPYDFDHSGHAVEKADATGHQRRYLGGVSSGTRWDAHGERMTTKCIESFMDQANSGDVLLYADNHGINFTEDIGILKSARVLPSGDWYTEFRLYDEHDPVDTRSRETADKLWKQVRGLPPYTKPRQKGFSVEGYVPPDGIMEMEKDGSRRVMNDVLLDGVVVVPRPAYQDSIAHAVYKALGETPPWVVSNKITKSLRSILEEGEVEDAYFRRKFAAEEGFENIITDIVNSDVVNKEQLIEEAVQEYGLVIKELVMRSQSVFRAQVGSAVGRSNRAPNLGKQALFSQLFRELEKLDKLQKERRHEGT